jgi:hypothetical protein
MTNINIEEIDYDANSPTYVEMIIDTVLSVDKKAGEELSDEERKIKTKNEVYHDLYKAYFNMYSDEAKKEIKSVSRKFTDLIKGSKKQNAVEDMEYFYRNFLVDFLFAGEERDVILSRLHLAMKSYVGSNIVFLKRNDDMVVYSPARK